MKTHESLQTTATHIKPVNYSDYTMYDGYQWQQLQYQKGLWSNPAMGDWPYVIFANGNTGDNYVIKEYAEHDVKVWLYANSDDGIEEYTHHLDQLKAYYKDLI